MSRHIVLAMAVVVSLSTAGCIENMGDLKVALGVVEPAAPPPVYAPPMAKIDAVGGATVGVPVTFVGRESRDPQGLALLFAWDFGDGGRASSPVARHTFERAGEFVVRLVVTNAAGLSDEDTLALVVSAVDRAPSVGLRAPAVGVMGEPLAFEAFGSDPEGTPLAFQWDFGDGATSHDARPTHAYAAPGVYVVSVRAIDGAGQRAEDSARVVVDGAWRTEGTLGPMDAQSAAFAFPVAPGAREVKVALVFEEGVVNDLEVALFDAAGKEVARSDAGLGGAASRALYVEKPAPGEWSLRVVKDSGVSVAWSVEVLERLS